MDVDELGSPSEGPLGQSPRGLLFYGSDGYLSVSMMRTDQVLSPGPPFMGYAGRWQLSGGLLTHRIEVCSNPAWADTDQTRELAWHEDQLVLSGSAQVNGRPQRRVLTWRRD